MRGRKCGDRTGRSPRFHVGQVSSENLQSRSIASVTVRLHDNLHILVERYQEAQKAFHGKLPELTAQHLRNIGLADSEQADGLHLFEAASFQDGVNLEYQLRLDQMLFRVRHTDVLEHIAASEFVSLLVTHGFLPLAIRSASRSRCLINSMSWRGVSRPVFDFFGKACRTYTLPACLNVYTARNVGVGTVVRTRERSAAFEILEPV
jgi:hypothetical protein